MMRALADVRAAGLRLADDPELREITAEIASADAEGRTADALRARRRGVRKVALAVVPGDRKRPRH